AEGAVSWVQSRSAPGLDPSETDSPNRGSARWVALRSIRQNRSAACSAPAMAGGRLGKRPAEVLGRGRDVGDAGLEQELPHRHTTPIERLVRLVVGGETRALEREPREQPLRLRVRIDLGIEL